jgi:hypothetical protein
VAELVLHDGGRELLDDQPTVIDVPPNASREAIHRTVYLQAPPRRDHSLTARLAIVFLTSFASTTLVVLASWGLLTRDRPPAPMPQEVRVVEVERHVPVPVPVPFRVEVAPTPVPVVTPAPRPSQRPRRPRPAPVAQAPIVEPEPILVESQPPTPVPVVAPPPPPVAVVPAAAEKLSGTYAGKADGQDVVFQLVFGPEGSVQATIVPQDGSPRRTASGEYKLDGTAATIMLMEKDVADPVVYTGTVDGSSADGRMTSGTRSVGRFSVGR